MDALDSVNPKSREDVLRKICINLDNVSLKTPLPPKENSMALDHSCKDILRALEDVTTSKEFLETTESKEMQEITKQIECITGYNIVTEMKRNITKIKVDSIQLINSLIIQDNEKKLKEAFCKDIAKLHGINPDDVYIRRIVPGSIEVLFSLPESITVNSNLNGQILPSFNSILQTNGITNYNYSQMSILPDPRKAREILQNYTRPITITTEENGSQIMAKFGKYLPVLASLSTNIRVVHKSTTRTLEIHGPPSAKGELLAYFAEIEDLLQEDIPLQIEIVEEKESIPIYPSLWNVLYDEGKQFTLSAVNYHHTLQTNTIRINSNLVKGCPAAQSFVAALKRLNLDPSTISPEQIRSFGVYGWHGTRNADNVMSIALGNLDPRRRTGQAFGPGEYCADDMSHSQAYWGNTNTLFLFFILTQNNPYYRHQSYHVVNNPSQEEMYMVPILIATFDHQIPLKIEPEPKPTNLWKWKDDDGFKPFGIGQLNMPLVQFTVEKMYQKFQNGISSLKFTYTFIRLNNKKTDIYKIDFSNMKQTNIRTGYTRDISRN